MTATGEERPGTQDGGPGAEGRAAAGGHSDDASPGHPDDALPGRSDDAPPGHSDDAPSGKPDEYRNPFAVPTAVARSVVAGPEPASGAGGAVTPVASRPAGSARTGHAGLASAPPFTPSDAVGTPARPAPFAPSGSALPGSAPSGFAPSGFASPGSAPSGSAPPGFAPLEAAPPGWTPLAADPTRSGRRRGRRRLPFGLVAGLVAAAFGAGVLGGLVGARVEDRTFRPADAGLPAAIGTDGGDRAADGVAGIAARVLPSVVSIKVTTADGAATGSGVVLRQDGYLLTNHHVVARSGEAGATVVVLLADGSQESATVVGSTADYDLAVLKIEVSGLVPLVLGDSDTVQVGDPVVAVGAPLGLAGTVTSGIVSALNRPVVAGDGTDATAFINAIQTDAAINPGNSGGPLVNTAGEVIGINSAIAQPPGMATASGGSIGLGFAIPSNQARRTAEQLIETGVATYPVIGVLLDPAYTGEGVQVTTTPQNGVAPVTSGGPADRAGIRAGDVILAIDGRPVTASDELVVAIRSRTPGDAVVLRVRSGNDERDVRVVLDESAAG